MTDFPIQTDPNRKLYEHIDGHPSHTPPNAPQGPAWWRKKGGWDRFAASVLEQSKYLGRMTKLLEQMDKLQKAIKQAKAEGDDATVTKLKADLDVAAKKFANEQLKYAVKVKKTEGDEGFILDEIKTFRKHLPSFAAVIIDERDEYLTQSICEIGAFSAPYLFLMSSL